MSKSKLVNKEINTTLGITIFLMAATFLILIDFFIISREIDHVDVPDTGKKVVEKADNDNNTSVNDKSNVLTEQEALAIGNDLYKKAGNMFVHRGLNVEVDENSQSVLYRRNDDDSFIASTDFDNDHHEYEKLIISDVTDLLSEKMFSEFCSKYEIIKYQDSYYRIAASRGANESYNSTELKVLSISSDVIVFDAVSSYFVNPAERFSDNAELRYESANFELKKENNFWKVNEFTLAY